MRNKINKESLANIILGCVSALSMSFGIAGISMACSSITAKRSILPEADYLESVQKPLSGFIDSNTETITGYALDGSLSEVETNVAPFMSPDGVVYKKTIETYKAKVFFAVYDGWIYTEFVAEQYHYEDRVEDGRLLRGDNELVSTREERIVYHDEREDGSAIYGVETENAESYKAYLPIDPDDGTVFGEYASESIENAISNLLCISDPESVLNKFTAGSPSRKTYKNSKGKIEASYIGTANDVERIGASAKVVAKTGISKSNFIDRSTLTYELHTKDSVRTSDSILNVAYRNVDQKTKDKAAQLFDEMKALDAESLSYEGWLNPLAYLPSFEVVTM